MKTELTLNALQSMNAQEYEDIRAAGSDMRRNLTHEVMREVDAPAYFHERRSLNNFHRDRVITFEQIAE